MLQNYFRLLFRNLLKRKLFSLINLLGLAIGMAVCLVLVLYIQHEFGYDTFHADGDRIYRLALERKYPGRSAFIGEIPVSVGQAVQQEFPEVEQSVRVMQFGGDATPVRAGEKNFDEKNILVTDSNFFQVFSGTFVEGRISGALQKPQTAVVSETTAIKLFGSAAVAMGKNIVLNNTNNYIIDGVCRDWPEKSHLKFSILLSSSSMPYLAEPNYYDLIIFNYLKLKQKVNAEALEGKLPVIVEKYVAPTIEKGFGESYEHFKAEGNGYRYFLQPLKKIHLYSDLRNELQPGGSIQMVMLSAGIGVFILLLACINFINLSTAVSVERAREVGIRKTFGSARSTIVFQFLFESVLFALGSAVFSLLFVYFLLPVFNTITGSRLSMAALFYPVPVLLLIACSMLTGLLAGLYPAAVMSSFRPILVLKGRFKSSVAARYLRNGLVVFQFTLSVILIVCTLVVNNQMQYMLGDKLGFKKDHVIVIKDLYRLQQKQHAFIETLSGIAGVESISRCNSLPDGKPLATCAMTVEDSKVQRTEQTAYVDERYMDLLGLTLKEGRFFSREFTRDSFSLVLNEEAVKDFGLQHPIGAHITSTETFFNARDGKTKYIYTVVGVMKDYHFQSLQQKIAPLVLANTSRFGGGTLGIRINPGQFKTTVAAIEKQWSQAEPAHAMQYQFLDQSLAEQYKAEQSAEQIFSIFAVLAILIACIGLFGLATYATLQRAKEISIRKVLGAGTGNILFILSKDFLRLVLVAILVAFPLSYIGLHQWLQHFEYRVNIAWWIFVTAGATACAIALFTISFQAIKAAVANPSKSLRAE